MNFYFKDAVKITITLEKAYNTLSCLISCLELDFIKNNLDLSIKDMLYKTADNRYPATSKEELYHSLQTLFWEYILLKLPDTTLVPAHYKISGTNEDLFILGGTENILYAIQLDVTKEHMNFLELTELPCYKHQLSFVKNSSINNLESLKKYFQQTCAQKSSYEQQLKKISELTNKALEERQYNLTSEECSIIATELKESLLSC